MKEIYVPQTVTDKIKEFNSKKAQGIHMPFVGTTFMSGGTRSMFWCEVQGRLIKFMSQGEKYAYLNLIFDPQVVDIKEQYPLDYVRTQEIAKELKIIHPRDHLTGALRVITSDFVITYRDENGLQYRKAVAYKDHFSPKNEARTKQKLLIEEKYWKDLDELHDVKLKADLCLVKTDNLLRFSEQFSKLLTNDQLRHFARTFFEVIYEHPLDTVKETLFRCAEYLKIQPTSSYKLFANCVLRDLLHLDMHLPIEFHLPAKFKIG